MRGRIVSKAGVRVAGLAALTLAVAACSGSSGGTAKASKSTGTTAAAASSPSTAAQASTPAHPQVLVGTATGKSPCELAAPTPASPGQVGAGTGGSNADATKTEVAASEHGERGMLQQFPLTQPQRGELEVQIQDARNVALKYPTVADAVKAGYFKSTPFVPCIGAHYTNISLARQFNPSTPSELLYDGTQPNSKIVGLSYLVYQPGGGPPPGFAGPNDHWHQHNANGGLCLRGGLVIGGEDTSRQDCAARGGRKTLLTDIWMLHAWVVPGFECSWGTFSGECPELGGRLCGNAWESPDPKDISQCGSQIG